MSATNTYDVDVDIIVVVVGVRVAVIICYAYAVYAPAVGVIVYDDAVVGITTPVLWLLYHQ